MKRARNTNLRAFSLVEIALAIGVVAVALVSIVGLLGVAADANVTSGRDTLIVAMGNEVINDLRSAPSFDALWSEKPRDASFVAKPTGSSAQPADSVYRFDAEGRAMGAQSREVYFECVVKKTALLPAPSENKGASNLLQVQLTFTWPAGGKTTPGNRRIIHGSIARY